MKETEIPKGFTCECGKFHDFGVYVMAHWSELLVHTCPECGRRHDVQRGRVALKRERKTKKRA